VQSALPSESESLDARAKALVLRAFDYGLCTLCHRSPLGVECFQGAASGLNNLILDTTGGFVVVLVRTLTATLWAAA